VSAPGNAAFDVGPVLEASARGRAVAQVIAAENPGTRVVDRGAYLRVSTPERCFVARGALERALGEPFALPRDLEALMPAFRGILRMDDEGVEWSLSRK
jgi:hypothetical protein